MSASTLHHLAVIMDGNGRWALSQNKLRKFWHQAGVEPVKMLVEYCAKHSDIQTLTLFAYSLENIKRPRLETQYIESLLIKTLEEQVALMHAQGVRIRVLGDLDAMSKESQHFIASCEQQTTENNALQLNICYRYSGRWHIAKATQELAQENRSLTIENISARLAKDLGGDPDLLIRTGGDVRVSNFLLWNLAYTELYFTDCYWPDFTELELQRALAYFKKCNRKYGQINADG